jgi:hypothetical protein
VCAASAVVPHATPSASFSLDERAWPCGFSTSLKVTLSFACAAPESAAQTAITVSARPIVIDLGMTSSFCFKRKVGRTSLAARI